MTQVKLRDIASIRIGYAFRSSVERDPNGTVGVIQMKDIDQYNQLELSDVYRVQIEDLKPEHLLKKDDILFRSKGVSNTAALVSQDVGQCVASELLTVIRVKKAIAGYIAWYINQPYGQYQIKRFSKGSSLLSVSNTELGELKIELPPLERQQLIAEVAVLSQREQQIMDKLTRKRQVYTNAVLMKQVKAE
ncbi:MAG: restriction endonuclease subunit S [Kastovskya adunca ATA6-11-RM4]|jgi:restriction endonuclease S subunit|nr:restriction endonuclease subunit S [Kastovskya adunca ATA6-11-RM4]